MRVAAVIPAFNEAGSIAGSGVHRDEGGGIPLERAVRLGGKRRDAINGDFDAHAGRRCQIRAGFRREAAARR